MDERTRTSTSASSTNSAIVVIDDEEVMRSACRDILEDEGYHVETFASAEDGLDRIRREPPAIAIVDLMMPKLHGREVLRRIRATAPSVRAIVITGYATVETEAEIRDIGAFGFLAKPFTPGELRRLVEKALAAGPPAA